MQRVKLALMLAALLLSAASARAQEPGTSAIPAVSPTVQGPVVLELFSSQACIFCPRADRLFADIVASQPDVIGLACHVDYFDVKEGSLAQPFCTARQMLYAGTLHAGPSYTPQMVMQGAHDIVGYKIDDVTAGLKLAAQDGVIPLYIMATGKENEFRIALPDTAPLPVEKAEMILVAYDSPHDVTIAEGRNKGQKMTYVNIVSDIASLGPWPGGNQGTLIAAPPLTDSQAGFALLLQDPKTGKITAAGKFTKKEAPSPAAP